MIYYDLVIMNEDERYNERLMEYIRKNHYQRFNVISTTKINDFSQYLDREKTIILLSEEWGEQVEKFIDKHPYPLLFYLSEDQQEDQHKKILFKYQKISDMIKEIIGVLAHLHGQSYFALDQENKNIMGIYSPIGGVGKTSTALVLASIMATYEKVLYLNMEYFPSTNGILNSQNKYNLSDVIYYAMKDDLDLSLKIESMVNREEQLGFYYFNNHNTMEDIVETDQYLWIKIFRALGSTYDKIVIDFDSHYDEKKKELMSLCHHLIIIGQEHKVAKERLRRWYHYAAKDQLLEKERTIFIGNKFKCQGQFDFFIKIEPDVVIEYDSAYSGFDINQLLQGEFANKLTSIYQLIESGSRLE